MQETGPRIGCVKYLNARPLARDDAVSAAPPAVHEATESRTMQHRFVKMPQQGGARRARESPENVHLERVAVHHVGAMGAQHPGERARVARDTGRSACTAQYDAEKAADCSTFIIRTATMLTQGSKTMRIWQHRHVDAVRSGKCCEGSLGGHDEYGDNGIIRLAK